MIHSRVFYLFITVQICDYVLYSYTNRELQIFGLDAVRFDCKTDERIAKFWEVVAYTRLLVVPATLAVTRSLRLSTIYALVSRGVSTDGNMYCKVTPVYLLYNSDTYR